MPVDSLSGPPMPRIRQSAEKRPVSRRSFVWCLDVPGHTAGTGPRL